MGTILVIGALGQIGSELTRALRLRHGDDGVVAADVKGEHDLSLRDSGACLFADVTQPESIAKIIVQHQVRVIYHMAAILSAVGETNPQLAWRVNVNGLHNVLEVAREHGLYRLFWPSSMAVFGRGAPRNQTPQETVLQPATMYGLTKVSGELLCNYYYRRYGLDVRGIRYPGIISSETLPGGGTTDYAVEIFYEAVRRGRYVCFVREDTVLPMMYMPDCIRATLQLMDADLSALRYHANYNLSALSFSVAELAAEIRTRVPGFACEYKPDFRQEIADTWPRTIDDSAARADWGWEPEFDLAATTEDMLASLSDKHRRGLLPGKARAPAVLPGTGIPG
jgi:nucleoside-diphosphate-sugar epimerase